jgi:endogenous inhibitor of DNA gyrase (YacG/DUF329 family)
MLGPETNTVRVLQWNYERDPALRGLEPREVKPQMIKTTPQLIETTCSSCGSTYRAIRAPSADRPATFSLTGGALHLCCGRCRAVTDVQEWAAEPVEAAPQPTRSPGWP